MHIWLRLLGLLMAALATAAAVAQINDPDAIHWVIGYAVSTVTSLLFLARVMPRGVGLLLGGFYFGWGFQIAVEFIPTGAPWNPDHQFLAEEVREMGGLAIFGAWAVASALLSPKRVATR